MANLLVNTLIDDAFVFSRLNYLEANILKQRNSYFVDYFIAVILNTDMHWNFFIIFKYLPGEKKIDCLRPNVNSKYISQNQIKYVWVFEFN